MAMALAYGARAAAALMRQRVRAFGWTVPVAWADLVAVAEAAATTVQRVSWGREGPLGLTAQRGARQVILINGAYPLVVQRFTLGHELGHVLFHRDLAFPLPLVSSSLDQPAAASLMEREANKAAAESLLPWGALTQWMAGRDVLTTSTVWPWLAAEVPVWTQAAQVSPAVLIYHLIDEGWLTAPAARIARRYLAQPAASRADWVRQHAR